ncbi:hypothetical protein GDO78_021467 [Eleutherodactylus coqui]|uniref:Uncharacterized protein n=1 Tax=Eleutherodactylus coqui TaxID=57060 RepID=A0A8J6C599_ELECQ|nr:hypothetical protein GDO78_021467 [Eleutherodactylus coqui]
MQSASKMSPSKPFKQKKNFATRKSEVITIKAKFPTKIPVIIERYKREKYLPLLNKKKFLAPRDLPMSQFVTIIRYVYVRYRKNICSPFCIVLCVTQETPRGGNHAMFPLYKMTSGSERIRFHT